MLNDLLGFILLLLVSIFVLLFFVVFMFLDIIVLAIVLYYVGWLKIITTIAVISGIQTIRNRNKDIFRDVCTEFPAVQNHLDDPEWTAHSFTQDQAWEETESSISRTGAYTLYYAPHMCTCQPSILHSFDRHYRALVYHTSWRWYFFFQRSTFTIRYERVPSNPSTEDTH